MTIGEKIYNLRVENKLSQDDLAAELKVSRHTVGKWENDTVSPSAENLSRLCKFFKVDANYFIGGQTEVAATELKKDGKISVYKVLLITFLSLLSVAFIVADVFLGLLAFSSNNEPSYGGDAVSAPPFENANVISSSVFWIMIAVTVVFISGVAVALYLFKKKKINY